MADDQGSPVGGASASPLGTHGASSPNDGGASPPKSDVSPPKSTGSPAPAASPQAQTGILGPEHWAAQAQQEDDDANSDLGSDAASSTASITSTILQYRTIHGRSYHSEQGSAQYWGSNDQPQQDVMDINHHTLTLGIGDKLHLAPLEPENLRVFLQPNFFSFLLLLLLFYREAPCWTRTDNTLQTVLDIGTGTGIWAIDFADLYPNAHVIGTDISPIQPAWVPPNLQFEIEDCTREWTFHEDSIDYTHIRWLVGSIQDWDWFMGQAYRITRPGGWVESHETSSIITSDDNTVAEDSPMGQWGKFFIEGSKKLGSTFTVVEDGLQRKAMEAAGFVDIHEFDFKCPIGDWPKDPVLKEMGRFTQHGLETDTEGFVLFMGHTLGWSREEIQVYIAQLRNQMRSGASHAYYNQKVVWGRKPN
ncbi:S-adenosyl-L-methionine-dependent methyltransferase [Stachybotrys elegans]|uniref:S-adenosyl-L-methionine-dependent methyltransferase n=1 Tax=Stachybotrys elegans TaxID=80388 RepID=A0A8K0SIH8_9HYPO|nr:S-adenosyl-L-methionine-dependent methyltransferase [Stachybotrys elegans]